MRRKDTSLRTFLVGATGGKASGTGKFGERARPISIVESFQIEDMNEDATREMIVGRMRFYYGDKWMDGFEDCEGTLEFYTKDGFDPKKRVRVMLEMDGGRPNYCRVDVERQ